MGGRPIIPEVLCQPGPGRSCGACCGLYNRRGHSRVELIALLREVTESFRETGGVEGNLEAYSAAMRPLVDEGKLCEDVFNCEFLGFLDDGEARVGCMLHPEANGGSDLRGISFHGEEMCRTHLCPSHTKLTDIERLAVVAGTSDWYLYGLVVTDIDLVKEFFRLAAAGLGEMPGAERLVHLGVRSALSSFFTLKETWPFRDPRAPRLGKYRFSGESYDAAGIDYEALSMPPSRFHRILVSLESSFHEAGELVEAEAILASCLETFRSSCLASMTRSWGPDSLTLCDHLC